MVTVLYLISFTKMHDSLYRIKLGKCMIFQLQDLNAQLILNAQITLHAYKKNVKTLVILIHVVEMQNVRQKIIEQFVFVFMDMLEILTPYVKSVRLQIICLQTLIITDFFIVSLVYIVSITSKFHCFFCHSGL